MVLQAGQALKQFRVEGLLGRGGMGIVYSAVDTRLERPVAVKVLKPEATGDESRRVRFLQEARAASAVNHPAIAQVYDVDSVGDITFIAMELVEGRTVRELIEQGELDLLSSLDIAIQVADGLAKAHGAGVVHRDIKPENVRVTPDGHAKILDFGLAKLQPYRDGKEEWGGSDIETLAKTQAGMIMGTLAYMSPEQARGRPADHRSDLFSLGVMLYEMITGEAPFRGQSPLDTMHAIAFEETTPVTQVRAGLPYDVQRIVGRCLAKDPQRRFQSASELAEALRRLRRDTESGVSRPVPLSERLAEGLEAIKRLSPSWTLVGIAAVVASVAIMRMLDVTLGSVTLVAFLGLLAFRKLRDRTQRKARRIADKLRKMPEVRLVTLHANQLIVVADAAPAQLYLRVNRLAEKANRRLVFGEPLTVSVRSDVPADQVKQLLSQPGLLYVSDEAAAPPR